MGRVFTTCIRLRRLFRVAAGPSQILADTSMTRLRSNVRCSSQPILGPLAALARLNSAQLNFGIRCPRASACRTRTGTSDPSVAHAPFDYSDLTPEERLQLVEDLWDSLAVGAPESVPIPESHARELERRAAEFREDGDPGQPWRDALDEIDGNLRRRGGVVRGSTRRFGLELRVW